MKVNSGRKDPAGVKHGGKLSGCRPASYSPLCSFVSFAVKLFPILFDKQVFRSRRSPDHLISFVFLRASVVG
jgi:hypothetical protein